MPTYRFQALNAKGATISGTLQAAGEREAARALDERGLAVIALDPATGSASAGGRRQRASRLRAQDLIVAFHELATMLQSGVALAEAVASQARSAHHPRIVAAFSTISTALRRGQSFSDALAGTDLPLPGYFGILVRAGEQSGLLAQALADGVAQLEYDHQVRGEIRQALTYPAVLVAAGLGAVVLMFTFVVPKFATLLERGADLPLLASAVLHGGLFARGYIGWIVGALALAAVFAARAWSRPQFRARLHERLERMPVIGPWLVESETAGWAKILATLLANRVPLLDALSLAREGVRSPQRSARLEEAARAVRAGTPLADALEEQAALTATGYNLVRVGERSGELPSMLRSLGRLCEDAGRVRMKQFLALLEPAAILVIGGVIGVIMIGIILAITSANDIVGR
jgi:general secretion pathway protein F